MAYTPFNTGNPIGTWGSVDPRDLVDNAAILDRWVNDQTITQWRDRFGVQRLTWNGMEVAFQQAQDDRQDAFDAEQAEHQADFDAAQAQRESDFNAFLLASGYQFIGDYDTDGPLTITQVNQIFSKDGEFWRAGASLALPYTTVNDWATDQPKFVSVGDAALRQELAVKVTSKRFEGTATDDAGTPDAIFRVNRTHAIAPSPHAFRDQTSFIPPVDGRAACSFDAAMTSTGTANIDHTIGFQSRNTHTGTGTLGKQYGGGSFNVAQGPVTSAYGFYNGDRFEAAVGSSYTAYGRPAFLANAVNSYGFVHYPTINSGVTVTNSIGLRVEAADGDGSLTNEFGIYIKPFTKGENRWPIYIEQTTGKSYIGSRTQVDQTLEVGGNARLSVGGSTGSDFPAVTYNYDPRANQLISNGDASGFQWSSTNFLFRHALSGSAGATPTFNTLVNVHIANDANRGSVFAGSDNAQSLGLAAARWSVVYSGTGSINTSDGTEKDVDPADWKVRPLGNAEISAAKSLAKEIGLYRFNAAIEAKGDGARDHIGMTVQRAIAIMEACGLDPMRYGFICYDEWPSRPAVLDSAGNELEAAVEAGQRYSFRDNELAYFILAGLQAFQDEIESRLAALEST